MSEVRRETCPTEAGGRLAARTEATLSDGRLARGEKTRRALAEAMIDLLEQGQDFPTARQVAQRAGVSLRLVFHHFSDVESILKAAVAVQAERHWHCIKPLRQSLDLQSRVRATVRQRSGLYEAIAPVRRAAAAIERTSPTVAVELARSRATLRTQLERTFAAELSARGGAEDRRLLDALESATSFETWDGLRRMGRSVQEARRTVELLAEGALHLEAATPSLWRGPR